MARYRGGRLESFGEAQGAPLGFINDLHRDQTGRLWVASSQDGLTRIDDPTAASPRFRRYTMAHGLSGNGVTALVNDSLGRIYAATGRGIDCLESDGGIVRRWTAADGLASHHVRLAFRDRHGHLWFGTGKGVSRLIPSVDVPADPPSVQ